jgi:hypothetical protein
MTNGMATAGKPIIKYAMRIMGKKSTVRVAVQKKSASKNALTGYLLLETCSKITYPNVCYG